MKVLEIYSSGGYNVMHFFQDDIMGMSNEDILKRVVYKMHRDQGRKAYYDNNMAVVLKSNKMQSNTLYILDNSPWYDIFLLFHRMVYTQENNYAAVIIDTMIKCITVNVVGENNLK